MLLCCRAYKVYVVETVSVWKSTIVAQTEEQHLLNHRGKNNIMQCYYCIVFSVELRSFSFF